MDRLIISMVTKSREGSMPEIDEAAIQRFAKQMSK